MTDFFCRPLLDFADFRTLRIALDTFEFLRHVMGAISSVRPKCSHRCVSLKEFPFKLVPILKHAQDSNRATLYENEIVPTLLRWHVCRANYV